MTMRWGQPIYGDGGQVAVQNWGRVAYREANAFSEALIGPSEAPPTAQSMMEFAMASAARQRQLQLAPVPLQGVGAVEDVKPVDQLSIGTTYVVGVGTVVGIAWGLGVLLGKGKDAGLRWSSNALLASTLTLVAYNAYVRSRG